MTSRPLDPGAPIPGDQQDLFLAMVSHELKTPLTVIMGALQTLQTRGDVLSEELRAQLLATALTRSRDLEQMINRLLRGARAELAASLTTVVLPELIGTAVAGFDQVRRLVVSDVPDVRVEVDAAAFGDVIGILIENAVAHSPEDTSVIVCTTADSGDVHVTVSNTGRLPPELDRSRMFEPFHRGRSARSAGVGLGLYIAARQAEAVGGRLSADSVDGFVVFTFEVPGAVVENGGHEAPA